jgi:TatD DNase family protein
MFTDSHCHLDLPPLSPELPQVLARAAAAGVNRFICPGVTPTGWRDIAATAAAHPAVFPAFGIHPQWVDGNSAAALPSLERYLASAVAVGEIGLDYSDRNGDRSRQQDIFRRQLRLALERSLPVILHCRHAFADLLRILDEEGADRCGGVMHAFSGSVEIAREAVARGLAIGIAGAVTWNGAVRPVQVVRELPLEQLLLETDAPDLTPEPWRGVANEPAFLVAIAEKIAAIKGVPLEAVARATTHTVERIFHVSSASLFPE